MGRCFNSLDLCLLPAATSGAAASAVSSDVSSPSQDPVCKSRSEVKAPESSQQITIFYNGRVCACDVTEIQARAILCMAKRETEERLGSRTHKYSSSDQPPAAASPASPNLQPTTGTSMKKSLQRFLQKRKNRLQSSTTSCPYNYSTTTGPNN